MGNVKIVDHGIVYTKPNAIFSYNGWPSICRCDDGSLLACFSGDRLEHVCPFGRVLAVRSLDEGKTWSAPITAINTPLDDRDAGIVNLGHNRLLLTSFTNSREMQRQCKEGRSDIKAELVRAYVSLITEEQEARYCGSTVSISEDGGRTWGEPFLVPITAPHGPIRLRSGALLYAGTPFPASPQGAPYPIHVYGSQDGRTFTKVGQVAMCPELSEGIFTEPHLVELPSGRLVLHIRGQGVLSEAQIFTICQSISDDGGKTWTVPQPTGAQGAPPHLLQHSSGALLCTYGKRVGDRTGIRVMISEDGAQTWEIDSILWEEDADRPYKGDLGYPASVELDNGDLLTVYYGVPNGQKMTSILWTRWRLR